MASCSPDQVVSRSSESEEGKILAHAGARSLAVRHTRPPTSQSCHAPTLPPSTTAPNVLLLTTGASGMIWKGMPSQSAGVHVTLVSPLHSRVGFGNAMVRASVAALCVSAHFASTLIRTNRLKHEFSTFGNRVHIKGLIWLYTHQLFHPPSLAK